MSKNYHRLLERQLKKLLPTNPDWLSQLEPFLEVVNGAYLQFDDDRKMLERSLEISSSELIEANSDMRAVFQAFPDIFLKITREGRILETKGGSQADPFYKTINLKGNYIQKISNDQVSNQLIRSVLEKIKSKSEIYHLEYTIPFENLTHHYEARFVPLFSDQIIVIIRNITIKKKMEIHTLRSQRMESIGTLAGGIAHDLNNLFSPMMLSIDILKQNELSQRQLKMVENIEHNLLRGTEMIKQVLLFARGIEGNRTVIFMDELVGKIYSIMQDTFPKSITFNYKIEPNVWPVMADETQIHQVLLNLCVNSRDAMSNGGTLSIEVKNTVVDHQLPTKNFNPGHYVLTTISDTGIGIPQHIIEKIFEPFFTTKEVGKGSGLGLSTALRITQSHDGTITVYSVEGKGTTFNIYLPVTDQHVVEIQNFTDEVELMAGNGEWVLVIDDEAPLRSIIKDTLDMYGYQVVVAANGIFGVEEFTQNPEKYDLVITDIMMPGKDGIQTMKEIRELKPKAKILASSGLTTFSQIPGIMEGNTGFLPKPFSAKELLLEVNKLIHHEK